MAEGRLANPYVRDPRPSNPHHDPRFPPPPRQDPAPKPMFGGASTLAPAAGMVSKKPDSPKMVDSMASFMQVRRLAPTA